MQISSASQNPRSDDPVWYLLAESSLSEFLPDHDPRNEHMVGLLSQTVRELGMPHGCVKKIEMILAVFAKEALVHFKQRRMEFPARIRIFCQKKNIDDANAARPTPRPNHTEPAMENPPMILEFGMKMNGGWGYFLIERGGGDSSTGLSVGSWNSVDLYLYKEGK